MFGSLFASRSIFASVMLAFTGGLLLGLTFLTGFYMTWFFVFFLMFALPVFVGLQWRSVVAFVHTNLKSVLVGFGAAATGLALGAIAVSSRVFAGHEHATGLDAARFPEEPVDIP